MRVEVRRDLLDYRARTLSLAWRVEGIGGRPPTHQEGCIAQGERSRITPATRVEPNTDKTH